MSLGSLERAIPPEDRILIDSAALIAHLNGGEDVSRGASHVLDVLVRSGRNPAMVSMVTVMEVLVRPRRKSLAGYQHALDFLTHHANLTSQPVDLWVAQEAATLRAMFNLSAPDALVVATGIVGQVGHLVTNDEGWKKKLTGLNSRTRVVHLGDHVPF
jgi:predicted nucleic acid-binding protein